LRVLVDTTYLLPAVGVAIRGIPETAILELRSKGHTVSICSISLFELAAKAARYIKDAKLAPEQALRGLRAVASDETVSKLPYEDADTLAQAFAFRREIPDFIDCLILSTAVRNCDVLATEDAELRGVMSTGAIRDQIRQLSARFELRRMEELLKG
jgi:predicted nucleic acid-binding protein